MADNDGHFNLPLLTNTGPIVQVTADYKRDVLLHYLEQKMNRPERFAIHNLLGFLAFQQGDKQGAVDHFNSILSLEEDPGNLNAKANLNYVQEVAFEENPIHGPDLSPETENNRKARRYAEHAYAFMFELFDETLTHGRYSKALELYNMAMELASDLDPIEKEDWQFGIGLASNKIFRIASLDVDKHDEARLALNKTVSSYGAIVGNNTADDAIKSESLLHLGLALNTASRRQFQFTQQDIEQTSIPQNLIGFITDPKQFLLQALTLAPDNYLKARIRARLATLLDQAGDFQGAMEHLNTSIELDGTKLNFHTYSTRARLNLKRYKGNRNHGNLSLLTTARNDLETVLGLHVSPWDFQMLADVYYQLAMRSTGQHRIEYIAKSLAKCDECKKCQDGANRPDLHKVRGQCLCLKGNHQQAKESYERGVECEDMPTGRKCGNVRLLAEEMTHLNM